MTSKQRAYLRGLANSLDAKYQIGKNGIDYNFLTQIRQGLEANELIKVHVLENSLLDTRTVCHELCERVDAQPVQVIGSKFIIYKRSEKNPQIELPKLSKKVKK